MKSLNWKHSDDNNSFLVPGINFETNISDQLNVNREDGTGVQNEDPDIPSTAEEKDNSNEDFVHGTESGVF